MLRTPTAMVILPAISRCSPTTARSNRQISGWITTSHTAISCSPRWTQTRLVVWCRQITSHSWRFILEVADVTLRQTADSPSTASSAVPSASDERHTNCRTVLGLHIYLDAIIIRIITFTTFVLARIDNLSHELDVYFSLAVVEIKNG